MAIAREHQRYQYSYPWSLEDTYVILKDEKVQTIGGIMHSFSGDGEWAKKFLTQECIF